MDEFCRTLAEIPEKRSIRGVARSLGHDKSTICRWMDFAGKHYREVTDYFLKERHFDRVQVDKIWSFIKKGEKRLYQRFEIIRSRENSMRKSLDIIKKILRKVDKKSSFHSKSFFIYFSKIISIGMGFFFWMVAARLFPLGAIGTASVLISSLNLINLFSNIGFDSSLIIFLPNGSKAKIIGTTLFAAAIISTVFGLIFIIINNFFINFLTIDYPVFFIIAVVAAQMVTLIGFTLISEGKAGSYLIQSIILSTRIILLYILFIVNNIYIFFSIGLSFLLAALYGLIVIARDTGIDFCIDRRFLEKSSKVSVTNYFCDLLSEAPIFLVPIMISRLLGENATGEYYVAFSIASVLLLLPYVFGLSFFVEASSGRADKKTVLIESVRAIYSLLIPAAMIIYFFGYNILGLYGERYLYSYQLLKAFSLSSLLVPIYYLYNFNLKGSKKLTQLLFLNFMRFVFLLCFTYLFIIRIGLIGSGYAWFITHLFLTIYIVYQIMKSNDKQSRGFKL